MSQAHQTVYIKRGQFLKEILSATPSHYPTDFCKSSFGIIFRVSFQVTIKKNFKCRLKILTLEGGGYFLNRCLLFIIQLDS